MKLSEFINESLLGIDMKGGETLYPATDNINVENGVCVCKPIDVPTLDKVYKKYEDFVKKLGFKIGQTWPDYKSDYLDDVEIAENQYVLLCYSDSVAWWIAWDDRNGASKL